MHLASKKKIVLLGMMSRMPVGGVVWQTMHYLAGFQRLGFEVYYVEAHGMNPSMFMDQKADDGSRRAAAFINEVMERLDLEKHWAFHALYDESRHFGMGETKLNSLYAEADLIINLHGGTPPLPEHTATGRLVFLETDPVRLQIELHDGFQPSIDLLEQHCALFTFGENYGKPGCGLPVSDRFHFHTTRQPVVLDFWEKFRGGPAEVFTTIGNWEQSWRQVEFRGDVYDWSKHFEFLKIIELPQLTEQPFELALSRYDSSAQAMLEEHGWRVRHALDFSRDADAYRDYICGSRGEFTVAKDQNVRLRSGWFSDRSATYLAAGRPVINQETGFSDIFPTGEGLFAFSKLDEVLSAIDAINSDYPRHCAAASAIAREYFDSDIVLGKLIAQIGATCPRHQAPGRNGGQPPSVFPPDLVITPTSRLPLQLPEATVAAVLGNPYPSPAVGINPDFRAISVIIAARNGLLFTKLCLESLIANTTYPNYEVVVIDNASTDGTREYLRTAASVYPNVRLLRNERNVGFAEANNQGMAVATGEIFVLLNNDTIVSQDWLNRLAWHLDQPGAGAVGPATNRSGTEADVDVFYHTYGELMEFMEETVRTREGSVVELPMLAMFCFALTRQTYEKIGPLDPRFEVGTFEDDDYAMRLRQAGLRVLCAEDVFIHHFGQASFGALVPTGEYSEVFEANKRRFEEKWDVSWKTRAYRQKPQYEALVRRVHVLVQRVIPPHGTFTVLSKGDPDLATFHQRHAWHFPQDAHGNYAGYYPGDSAEAIAGLEALHGRGSQFLVIPVTSAWWLQHYEGLTEHLQRNYRVVADEQGTAVIFSFEDGLS
jgi:GT2 family glycosyltransferase